MHEPIEVFDESFICNMDNEKGLFEFQSVFHLSSLPE